MISSSIDALSVCITSSTNSVIVQIQTVTCKIMIILSTLLVLGTSSWRDFILSAMRSLLNCHKTIQSETQTERRWELSEQWRYPLSNAVRIGGLASPGSHPRLLAGHRWARGGRHCPLCMLQPILATRCWTTRLLTLTNNNTKDVIRGIININTFWCFVM